MRMKIKTSVAWTARPGGGLAVGVQYHFAVSLITDNWRVRFTQRTLSFGFIFFRVSFDIETGHQNAGTYE